MPELTQDEAPDGYKKDDNNLSSSDSSPHTPITTSTLSSPASLSSPSPQTSALYRILSESYGNRQQLIDLAPTHYPREQNLLDLLIQASGVEDLQELYRMREIRLRIITSVISLSRLEVYTPNIKILRLDGSSITSLREIGTCLQQLKVLHVSKCGLTSLDGIFGLTNLMELYANDNDITDVGPCAILENIKVLSFDRNPIVSLSNVSLLSLCPKLSRLSLKGSPVSKDTEYRRNIRIWMPYLKKLDGQNNEDNPRTDEDEFAENNMEDSESSSIDVSSMTGPEEISSTTSKTQDSEYANCENSIGEVNIYRRPATAIGLPNISSNNYQITGAQRPCSAYSRNRIKHEEISTLSETIPEASSSYLTSGGIFCGNIARALSRAKPARRPSKPSSTKPVDDWVIGPPSAERKQEQTQDAPLEVCDHRSAILGARKFLNEPLPTKPNETTPVIELEMGVTGLIKDDSPDYDRNISSQPQWEESSQNVLRVSKNWRKAFRLYRMQRKFGSTDSNSLDSDEIA